MSVIASFVLPLFSEVCDANKGATAMISRLTPREGYTGKASGPSSHVQLPADRQAALLAAAWAHRVPSLAAQAVAAGLDWRDFPITDRAVPEPDQAAAFQQLLADLSAMLDEGARLAIHCRAGLGRSGLLAAALLVWRDVAADEAITAIRRCRPGAIESDCQERYLRSLA